MSNPNAPGGDRQRGERKLSLSSELDVIADVKQLLKIASETTDLVKMEEVLNDAAIALFVLINRKKEDPQVQSLAKYGHLGTVLKVLQKIQTCLEEAETSIGNSHDLLFHISRALAHCSYLKEKSVRHPVLKHLRATLDELLPFVTPDQCDEYLKICIASLKRVLAKDPDLETGEMMSRSKEIIRMQVLLRHLAPDHDPRVFDNAFTIDILRINVDFREELLRELQRPLTIKKMKKRLKCNPHTPPLGTAPNMETLSPIDRLANKVHGQMHTFLSNHIRDQQRSQPASDLPPNAATSATEEK